MGRAKTLSRVVRFELPSSGLRATAMVALPLICFLVLTAKIASAQQTAPPQPGNRDPFEEAKERQRREAQLRSLETIHGVPTKEPLNIQDALKQMKDDFKQIQILRNNVVHHLLAEKPLDYKFIADETVQINKRALRLAAHLHDTVDEAQKEADPQAAMEADQIKMALVTMCKRIDGFTESPQFKNPDVLDLKETEKALQNLREVIQLSRNISKVSERLKTGSKQ